MFESIWTSKSLLLQGAFVTVYITFFSMSLGLFLGTFAGIGRVSHNKLVRAGSNTYIQIIRGTPMLLQIYFFFFGLPEILHAILGYRMPVNALVLGIIALGLNSGAYIGEIIRAGIESIDKGQVEAARAIGLNHRAAMRYVILPQALRRMIPPLGNEFIVLLKDSSLISAIGVAELMFNAKTLGARAYDYTPYLVGAGIIYLTLTFIFSQALSIVEKKMRLV